VTDEFAKKTAADTSNGGSKKVGGQIAPPRYKTEVTGDK
jgi:hypothetical protein